MGVEIECPSGLKVEIRGLRMDEACVLADRQQTASAGFLTKVLTMCTEKVVSPGPYSFGESVDWMKAHVGDRIFALLRIRKATYRQPYVFHVPCGECRKPIDRELDLADLPTKPIPDEGRAALSKDRILTARWETIGKDVTFRLMLGEDEAKAQKLLEAEENRARVPLVAVRSRVVSIEGLDEKQKDAFLAHLEAEPLIELISLMDRYDGGVDIEAYVDCTKCGAVQQVKLPFDREFWLPKYRPTPKAS